MEFEEAFRQTTPVGFMNTGTLSENTEKRYSKINSKNLIEWSEKYAVIERTKKGFITYMENWKKENRGDFWDTFKGKSNLKLINSEFYSLQLTYINESNDFVYCNLNIMYIGEYVGSYRMVFTLDGEVADDSIDIDRFMDKIINEGTTRVEIIKKAIKHGYLIDEIAGLVELDKDLIKPLFES
ncbi:hypothetical protein [Paenibacillus sp. LS1]|uniref:hypothetical protein n=1 Tax=Paenibacillus sp. LS1 TaxID=2992120 RepID=UPI00223073D2|nr:hypothetical protein [Paenibacillus sp. LS1]